MDETATRSDDRTARRSRRSSLEQARKPAIVAQRGYALTRRRGGSRVIEDSSLCSEEQGKEGKEARVVEREREGERDSVIIGETESRRINGSVNGIIPGIVFARRYTRVTLTRVAEPTDSGQQPWNRCTSVLYPYPDIVRKIERERERERK